jgi:hypothetical protein
LFQASRDGFSVEASYYSSSSLPSKILKRSKTERRSKADKLESIETLVVPCEKLIFVFVWQTNL